MLQTKEVSRIVFCFIYMQTAVRILGVVNKTIVKPISFVNVSPKAFILLEAVLIVTADSA